MAATRTERDLLLELEPEAERLLERHLAVAEEWFPHEYVPWDRGRSGQGGGRLNVAEAGAHALGDACGYPPADLISQHLGR